MKFEKEYNTDEVNPPSSLIIRGKFTWVQMDILNNIFSSNNFETLQPLKLLREIKKEANGRKITFTKVKWFYIFFFLIEGFKYKKGELIYEV